MARFPRGSEWRKWDLHVHVPGTAMQDGYAKLDNGLLDLDRFCGMLHDSDVHVVGLTDYFRAENIEKVITRYRDRYPTCQKLLLRNIEFRLTEAVNSQNDLIDLHLIFADWVQTETLQRFLALLPTVLTDANNAPIMCADLTPHQIKTKATVHRDALDRAIDQVFGKNPSQKALIKLVPAKGDGIRPNRNDSRRRALTDEIDKFCDALFGGPDNSLHFATTHRHDEPNHTLLAKPVFAGSDSHSFEQLETLLGKSNPSESNRRHITWIKADPSFEGLLQTLYEPVERVRLSDIKPDSKVPYQVISEIRFSGTDEFPPTIPLNSNLSTIIGSRSSGKSSLLAYVSHTIDPKYTDQEREASGGATPGPAAGKSWKDVEHINCEVVWGSGEHTQGKVIYVPQNRLNALSDDNRRVTGLIRPALSKNHPEFTNFEQDYKSRLDFLKSAIRNDVALWFQLSSSQQRTQETIVSLGDRTAVETLISNLENELIELQQSSSLTESEQDTYASTTMRISELEAAVSRIDTDESSVGHIGYVDGESVTFRQQVDVSVQTQPLLSNLPGALRDTIIITVREHERSLISTINDIISNYLLSLREQKRQYLNEKGSLEAEYQSLFAKARLDTQMEAKARLYRDQQELLSQIDAERTHLKSIEANQSQLVDRILANISELDQVTESYMATCNNLKWKIDEMAIHLESGLDVASLFSMGSLFDQRQTTMYYDKQSETPNIETIRRNVIRFLNDLDDGTLRLKTGTDPVQMAQNLLSTCDEVRLVAEIETDRIGGFEDSSMTPGKRALFALTLILSQSEEKWPLLIDQPEDDLDSRSIYDQVVQFLLKAKKTRQIIMVTHNANLAIGSDSEQIIVANRHGKDRANRGERTFDYRSGSLEYSLEPHDSPYVLESCGIREHACIVLDGGEEAFRKRSSKYQVK